MYCGLILLSTLIEIMYLILSIVFGKQLEGVSMWQLNTFTNFCGAHCSVAYVLVRCSNCEHILHKHMKGTQLNWRGQEDFVGITLYAKMVSYAGVQLCCSF